MRFTNDSCKYCKDYALKFAPGCCTYCARGSFWFLNIVQFFCFAALWTSPRSFQIWLQILQILCNLPLLALHCCKILPDGKAPCSELMLHHTMQCTGASWEVLQVPSNFAANTTQLRNSKTKRPEYCTQILSHRGAFTQTCFYTDICTYTCFYPVAVLYTGMLLRTKLLHTDAWVLLHTGAFTQRCFYRGVLLHRASFNTN